MLNGSRVLAVVPARSGSKGIPGKNVAHAGGMSLIERAGRCLAALEWLDARVISTDDPAYAAEGERAGLSAPFLRPAELAGDAAGAVETVTHALLECERVDGVTYDIVLIVEPTSPLRLPADVEAAARMLVDGDADSVVTVSPLPKKYHPHKVFRLDGELLRYYDECGAAVVNRQELGELYWRNGACYALTRDCLVEKRAIITERSAALVIERDLVNVDDPAELLLADALLARGAAAVEEQG